MKNYRLRKAKGPYYCGFCFVKFSYKPSIPGHCEKIHNLEPRACRICGDPFVHFKDFVKHFNKIHIKYLKDTNCKICGDEIEDAEDFISHLKAKHALEREAE